MDLSLASDYLILAAISSFAVIQISASLSNKSRVMVLDNARFTIIFSVLITILSYGWFFASRDRNVQTYMEGAQIFGTFALGAIVAVLFTKFLKGLHESD